MGGSKTASTTPTPTKTKMPAMKSTGGKRKKPIDVDASEDDLESPTKSKKTLKTKAKTGVEDAQEDVTNGAAKKDGEFSTEVNGGQEKIKLESVKNEKVEDAATDS